MDEARLRQLLGWGSVAGALSMLGLTGALLRALELRERRGLLLRALGLRDLVIGAGLLRRRDPRPWLWARTAGDALDGALVARTLAHRVTPARLAVGLGAALLTAVDLHAALRAT